MTRDDVEGIVLDFLDDLPLIEQREAIQRFSDHDAAQRVIIKQQAKEIARLREALGKLHGLQNGCPLPKYEAEYLYCMMQVERLLGLDKEEHP